MVKSGKQPFDISTVLLPTTRKEYGGEYRKHLLDQYVLYVKMADRISSRRATANSFFLTISVSLVTAMSALTRLYPSPSLLCQLWTAATAAAGVALSLAWLLTVRAYRLINEAKFQVINSLEKKLPAAGFEAERTYLEEAGKKRKPARLTTVESVVPAVFLGMFILLLVVTMLLLLAPLQ
jgi:hypothetical protein